MISLVVVNFRTAELAIEAIRTARAATVSPLQTIVVDNSLDPDEAERLKPHCDVLIVSATNRGYSGAINDGRRAADGELLVVSNPDVTFGGGALDLLANAEAAVAGPALYWDSAFRWHLPPAELHTAREKLDVVLASRSRAWRARRDARRIRERVAFWRIDQTTRVNAISGAVMAIRTKAFDDAGGFDERFPLYFEENDFLRRVNGPVVYVPQAKCRHLYNQSAAQHLGHAASAYAQSELRYVAKWNGPWAARTLKWLEKPLAPAEANGGAEATLIEASPEPSFNTAAGAFGAELRLPDDVMAVYRGESLYLRSIDLAMSRVRELIKITP